jgi:hypothetical protein
MLFFSPVALSTSQEQHTVGLFFLLSNFPNTKYGSRPLKSALKEDHAF